MYEDVPVQQMQKFQHESLITVFNISGHITRLKQKTTGTHNLMQETTIQKKKFFDAKQSLGVMPDWPRLLG